MDNLTKGFVIAACSVVIATPIVWFTGQVQEAKRQERIQALELKEQAERDRQVQRVVPCKDRADELFPVPINRDVDSMMKKLNSNSEFYRRCLQSTAPVAEVQ